MKYDKLFMGTNHNPYYNLAWEEILFRQQDEAIILWQNSPSVIVGRHQNTLRETDETFINKQHINLVRRMTGGGAVYHDLGNLNFSFIFNDEEKHFDERAAGSVQLITDFLSTQGVEAFKSGRNDICIKAADGEERKVSGCAMMQRQNRGIIHGTLLFSTDIEMMTRALRPSPVKLESKGILSVRSRVANLREASDTLRQIDIQAFASELAAYLKKCCCAELQASETYDDEANRLMREKYQTWSWNYGRNPECMVQSSKKFPIGTVELNLQLKQGVIEDCYFSGDYIDIYSLDNVKKRLHHIPYTRAAIKEAISGLDFKRYWGTDCEDTVLNFFKEGE